jgi:hypothetical protein
VAHDSEPDSPRCAELELVLHLAPGGPPRGSIGPARGKAVPFEGWIELMAALNALRRQDEGRATGLHGPAEQTEARDRCGRP